MTRPRRHIFLALLITALFTAPAVAQVRDAPAGNNLPEEQRVDEGALRQLVQRTPRDTAKQPAVTRQQHADFAKSLDLDQLRRLAVFDNGRVKILDTLAREQLKRIFGKPAWEDSDTGVAYDPLFTYLDLVFNRQYYADKAIIHVDKLPLRRRLLEDLPAAERETWLRRGRLSPQLLMRPHAQRVMQARDMDLRFMEARDQLFAAIRAFDGSGSRLVMVSPGDGADRWAHLAELRDARLASTGDAAVAAAAGNALNVANPDAARAVDNALRQLATAWRRADAPAANDAIGVLTSELPRINPATYPPRWKLQLEQIYNATHKFTLGYLAYLAGTITLLIAFAVGRRWVMVTGAALAASGFAVHTAGMLVRGILSGRWPIHNQFESFFAITWFAVGVGLVLMLVRRQWLFGAAAAALGACALLVANMTEIPSNDVGQVAGILATSNILYVHVNVVLCSYALIALGFFISLFYLGVHYFGKQDAVQFAATGLGHDASETDDTPGAPTRGKAATLHDLDKAQMIVLQLAFWGLGTGILLGAYWADHAWGRWWGWDPKETWALITLIVYLIAIHVRYGVQRRGLATAWLSVVGFFVMLWTYWGVNLLLAGLHSSA